MKDIIRFAYYAVVILTTFLSIRIGKLFRQKPKTNTYYAVLLRGNWQGQGVSYTSTGYLESEARKNAEELAGWLEAKGFKLEAMEGPFLRYDK